MATLQIAETTGVANCISFDMGGTSTDVSLLKDRVPDITLNGKLGIGRFNFPCSTSPPSDAVVAALPRCRLYGSLTVGPASAGADPGPVCYGRGATRPTVTDANLVLGRVNTQIAGGQLTLDRDAAVWAIDVSIASPLGLEISPPQLES